VDVGWTADPVPRRRPERLDHACGMDWSGLECVSAGEVETINRRDNFPAAFI
jgi:hypothetical protein